MGEVTKSKGVPLDEKARRAIMLAYVVYVRRMKQEGFEAFLKVIQNEWPALSEQARYIERIKDFPGKFADVTYQEYLKSLISEDVQLTIGNIRTEQDKARKLVNDLQLQIKLYSGEIMCTSAQFSAFIRAVVTSLSSAISGSVTIKSAEPMLGRTANVFYPMVISANERWGSGDDQKGLRFAEVRPIAENETVKSNATISMFHVAGIKELNDHVESGQPIKSLQVAALAAIMRNSFALGIKSRADYIKTVTKLEKVFKSIDDGGTLEAAFKSAYPDTKLTGNEDEQKLAMAAAIARSDTGKKMRMNFYQYGMFIAAATLIFMDKKRLYRDIKDLLPVSTKTDGQHF
jgi:hypothetical protein